MSGPRADTLRLQVRWPPGCFRPLQPPGPFLRQAQDWSAASGAAAAPAATAASALAFIAMAAASFTSGRGTADTGEIISCYDVNRRVSLAPTQVRGGR